MYTRILFPIDGSNISTKALHHALALARLCGAGLHTLSTKEVFPCGVLALCEMQPPPSQDFLESEEHAALQRIGAVMDAAEKAGVHCRASTVAAVQPWKAICDYAVEHSCDLIIMASHSRHGLTAFLRGSETPHVLGHCSVPVLVVR